MPADEAETTTVVRVGCGADEAVFDLADGARLTSLRLGRTELLVPRADRHPLWWGAFVMAPWTGDLPEATVRFHGRRWTMPRDDGPHASHGVARKSAWTQDGDGVLRTPLGGGWPFGGAVEVRAEVAASRCRLRLSVIAGRTVMPAALGWHPWFPRRLPGSDPVELTLPPGTRQLVRDDRGRATARFGPLGAAPYNETLELTGPAQLSWPRAGTLTISSTSALATVFSAHPQGVCVEPVTSPAERMDHVLGPGERLELGIDLTWAAAGA